MANGLDLKRMLQAGSGWLERHIHVVNGLNIFPVPDGDTGTNMLLTMRAALKEIEQAEDHHVGRVAAAAARGALWGARGNSGVILSQFLQGIATGLKDKTTFTSRDFAQAVDMGAQQAYQSVVQPVEGTMLTVARAAAEAASAGEETVEELTAQLAQMVAAARAAQARTPALLPVLKEAGVTDSGGQGLLYILEGALQGLTGEGIEPAGEYEAGLAIDRAAVQALHRYDVQFLLQGEQLQIAEIRAQLNRLGSSVLVVGDESLVRVHLHVDDPELPLAYSRTLGRLSDLVVEDMAEQVRAFLRQANPPGEVAVVAIVDGPELGEIFKSLGADQIIQGGPGRHPALETWLEVIRQIEAEDVLILPNCDEGLLMAQQAGLLSRKNIRVVSTRTMPEGISALLAFNRQAALDHNLRRMIEVAEKVVTLEITRAGGPACLNGREVRVGDVPGLCHNLLGQVDQTESEVVLALLAQVEAQQYEVMTLYWGQEVLPEEAEALSRVIEKSYPSLTLELYQGGQAYCHYIISLE